MTLAITTANLGAAIFALVWALLIAFAFSLGRTAKDADERIERMSSPTAPRAQGRHARPSPPPGVSAGAGHETPQAAARAPHAPDAA